MTRTATAGGIALLGGLAASLVRAPAAEAQGDDAAAEGPGPWRELDAMPPFERIDVGGGAPLSFAHVLRSTIRHHPAIEATRRRVRAVEGDRLAAEGGFDLQFRAEGWGAPQGYYDWARADVSLQQPTPLHGLSLYAGWRIGRGGDIPGYYGQYETLELGEVRAGVRIPLWRDGPIDARRARIRRAAHAVDAGRRGLEARMLRMRVEAARAYWSWVAAGRRYRVAGALLTLAEERDAQIAMRARAGAIPPIERLENRRVVLARRTNLVSARRTLERRAIALSLFHRGSNGSPRVPAATRVPLDTPRPSPLRVDLRGEIEGAWRRRPELARYRALLSRQRVSLELANNQLAPRIDLGFAVSADLGSGTLTEQAVLGTPVAAASIALSFPFQFREARGGVQRASAELAALRADAQLMRERIAAEVRDAFSAVRAAEERAALALQAAEVSEAVAEAERRRFDLGATPLFIVNLREQAAAAARAVLVDAEAALRIALAAWSAAIAGAPASRGPGARLPPPGAPSPPGERPR